MLRSVCKIVLFWMPSSARQSNQLILSMLSHTVHCQRLQLRLFLRAIVAPHCSLCLGRCVPLSQRVATPAMITKPIAWNRVGTAFIALMKREARHRLERHYNTCANRKKQCRPNETKPNHTSTRHTRAKDKIFLQMVTPQAASSQRTHVSRTQGTRPHAPGHQAGGYRVPAHTEHVTTRRRCGCNDKQEAPRDHRTTVQTGTQRYRGEELPRGL